MDQLYDAYNYGERTPYALGQYSITPTNLACPPAGCLLVGTASGDPRNYLGFGSFRFRAYPADRNAGLQDGVGRLADGLPKIRIRHDSHGPFTCAYRG